MELDFYKIHTCRNDYILLNRLYGAEPVPAELLPTMARRICDRHLGVGANGVVVLSRGVKESARIELFLPDGEPSGRLNDALICMARLAFDAGVSGGKKIVVECSGGERTVDFIDSSHFRVSLGVPLDVASGAEIREEPDREYAAAVLVDGRNHIVTPLRLQYDAAVHFHGGLSREKLMRLSRSLRKAGIRPAIHPIFAQVYSKDEMLVRNWFKREPVDYTSAAGIATVASTLNGFTEREALVHCNDEDVFVQWVESTGEVLATASASYLFSGTYYLDEEAGPRPGGEPQGL